MSERKQRIISGKISRGNISKPAQRKGKDGSTFESYSVLVEGVYKDTNEPFEGFLNSNFSVAVYDAKTQEGYIDVPALDGATFEGDVMVTEKGDRSYLYAINVRNLLEEATPSAFDENPFVQAEYAEQAQKMEQAAKQQAAATAPEASAAQSAQPVAPAAAPAAAPVQQQEQLQKQEATIAYDDIPF